MMKSMVNNNNGTNTINRISKRVEYLNTVDGNIVSKVVERVIKGSVFSIINRRSELYLYVGDNETPIDIVISSYNLQMQQGGLTAEVVIGDSFEEVKSVINKIEASFKQGKAFSILDFQTFLEENELINYKAIEALALKTIAQ